jgi:hypothetical protein
MPEMGYAFCDFFPDLMTLIVAARLARLRAFPRLRFC